jgi:hypothetical protein
VPKDVVRLGCWAAFWGDTPHAADQLLREDSLDYLVADHLSEITMALLARAAAKDPAGGFITDAVDVLSRILPTLHERGIKVVTNAGGLNPAACAAALQVAAEAAAVPLKVAAVTGDDLSHLVPTLVENGAVDMFTGQPLPARVQSLNAYLGAIPIAAALDAGADIVVTGRCVDAAVVLGPLLHEFGWRHDDYDLLSAGTLAGHVIECGPQCTGGNHTDWWTVPGWEDMGYPIAEVSRDGTTVITKPAGTGGMVTPATVGEQVLYEISDPGAYVMPDVVCDWRGVTLEQIGADRVRLSGARGTAPTTTYKATATVVDGHRVMTSAMFAGIDAAGRARRAGQAAIDRASRLTAQQGSPPFAETSIEVVGAGDLYSRTPTDTAEEVVVKIGLRHGDRAALEVFSRELASLALVAPGMTGLLGGRPRVSPVFRVLHLLVDKSAVPVSYQLGGEPVPVDVPAGDALAVVTTPALDDVPPPSADGLRLVPLRQIAYARSGDKGDSANIGVIARRAEDLALLKEQLTASRVADFFAHVLSGDVRRWEVPGLHALNFLLADVLGGAGGTSTLRYDPQGKSYASMLLTLSIAVPADWVPVPPGRAT